jgi:hypothetical protein
MWCDKCSSYIYKDHDPEMCHLMQMAKVRGENARITAIEEYWRNETEKLLAEVKALKAQISIMGVEQGQ